MAWLSSCTVHTWPDTWPDTTRCSAWLISRNPDNQKWNCSVDTWNTTQQLWRKNIPCARALSMATVTSVFTAKWQCAFETRLHPTNTSSYKAVTVVSLKRYGDKSMTPTGTRGYSPPRIYLSNGSFTLPEMESGMDIRIRIPVLHRNSE